MDLENTIPVTFRECHGAVDQLAVAARSGRDASGGAGDGVGR